MINESFHIRRGDLRDADIIAEFNRAMAFETEGKKLLADVIGTGVVALINNPALGFYLVAEESGQVVASLMITTEWSDWRNGIFWWIQSVYVRPESRRKGVYSRLYQYIRDFAAREPGVCGFRLYVEKDNLNAQRTYKNLGMHETDYKIYEEMRPGIRYCLQD
ncbi:GNAT family N-acetyltransferase [Noviherbaspirillum saxi]|uniref:GNAT family N-acetyltransferase n=1 Tax=Noviherbaspirillum saxi TaxID=2320863 RepID=A0A3A3FS24_9BURK|nr:GNAT family N-acetyltransferase [Noviherbaspirillum saxi]RJF98573.1 GNAT family N-acetyltransferase [Noviherbaspirillum saxi]